MCYRKNEQENKRAYDQRVREVEHGCFSPLVFSASVGMGPTSKVVYKKLAAMIATKHNQPYSRTINWLRCRLSFLLLRSFIMCLRGSRSSANTLLIPSSRRQPLRKPSTTAGLPLSEFSSMHTCLGVVCFESATEIPSWAAIYPPKNLRISREVGVAVYRTRTRAASSEDDAGLLPAHWIISLQNSSAAFIFSERTERELILLLKTLRCYTRVTQSRVFSV